MLQSYLPVLVFLGLGLVIGVVFTNANRLIGARRGAGPSAEARSDPYECGLPSEVSRTFRFGVPFYMTAMIFLVFDLEVVFLYATAPLLIGTQSVYALVAILLFIFFLVVGLIYDWARGGLDWN